MRAATLNLVNLGTKTPKIRTRESIFCPLDGLSTQVREKKRVQAIKKLGLLEAESVPVFDEATQSAARMTSTPICILGLMVEDDVWLKSAVGLSRLGLMNPLASSRKVPRQESFCSYVVDSLRQLMIEDTLDEPIFSSSILVQHYGIRSYLGVPLFTSKGECIGALAVMDIQPRQFDAQEIEFLSMTARWCLSEFERDYWEKKASPIAKQVEDKLSIFDSYASLGTTNLLEEGKDFSGATSTLVSSPHLLKVRLLEHLSQELKVPLTSIIGMTSVLLREIYGTLTNKQKEYLEIVYSSGQQMISLVEEIVNLGVFNEQAAKLHLKPTDMELLCQKVLANVQAIATKKQQGVCVCVCVCVCV